MVSALFYCFMFTLCFPSCSCANILVNYARAEGHDLIVDCWRDMNELTEFKQSDSFSIKALSIFAKYVQGTSVEYFGGDLALREECCAYFSNRRQADDSVRLEDAISHFRWLFCACFNVLFDKVYVSFRQSSDYLAAFKLAKTRFNVVRYDDFDYFGALGTGACGIVVKCRKKSTGKVYAMKIQRKTAQFEQFETEPWRVEDEKVAHAWLKMQSRTSDGCSVLALMCYLTRCMSVSVNRVIIWLLSNLLKRASTLLDTMISITLVL